MLVKPQTTGDGRWASLSGGVGLVGESQRSLNTLFTLVSESLSVD